MQLHEGRRILARWTSRTGRTCLLVLASDRVAEGYYEPRTAGADPEILEPAALEAGFQRALERLAAARFVIEQAKAEREAFKRAFAAGGIDLDSAVDDAGHRFANALARFEGTHGRGQPMTELLQGAVR